MKSVAFIVLMLFSFSVFAEETPLSDKSCVDLLSAILQASPDSKESLPTNDHYAFIDEGNSIYSIEWEKAYEHASRQCNKSAAREKVERTVEDFKEFEQYRERSEIDKFVLKKLILEALNKGVIETLHINHISIELKEKETSFKGFSVVMIDTCGYEIAYKTDSNRFEISAPRVQGSKGL